MTFYALPGRTSGCVLFFLLFSSFIFGQAPAGNKKDLTRFGLPRHDELNMRYYSPDSTAQAVILFDNGRFKGRDFLFTRHLRLKVLKSGGTSYANFVVQVPSLAPPDIDGYTYNLEHGQVVSTKLESAHIFKEKVVHGFFSYKVFFPAVKVGSVVDFRYTIRGLPSEWRFQSTIPEVYNELVLEPTDYMAFKKTQYGFGKINQDGDRWFAQDMPALVEEPLMSHYSNFVTRFVFDIDAVFLGVAVSLSSTWPKIGERFMQFNDFGGVIRDAPFLNEKASELKRSALPVQQKIMEAFRYIQKNIKWNGTKSAFATDECWTHFKVDHSGNAAEVNLLLISLLKKAGIEAYPLLLSTRDNGLLNPVSASMSTVNYVAAYVKDGPVDLVLDATEPYAVPGILPVRCRAVSGWVIGDKDRKGDGMGGWWLDLTTGKANSRKQYISIRSHAPGQYRAEVSHTYEDYDFLEWMDTFDDHQSEAAYIEHLKIKTTDLSIESCKVSVDKDKMKAVQIAQVDLTETVYIQHLEGQMLINPFIWTDIANPFRDEARLYPVDFVYPKNRSIIISLKMPEGYVLQKVPESLALKTENDGGRFSYMCNTMNDIINIRCDFKIDRQVFDEGEYQQIRNFLMEVDRKLAEPIHLIKKS